MDIHQLLVRHRYYDTGGENIAMAVEPVTPRGLELMLVQLQMLAVQQLGVVAAILLQRPRTMSIAIVA